MFQKVNTLFLTYLMLIAFAGVRNVTAEGDKVLGRYTLRGTFVPTGLPFEIAGMSILRIQDGLLAEEWLNLDNLSQIHAVRNFDTSSTMDYLVSIRNTRTNAIAIDQIRSGYFAAAFADLSRQSVVEVGDHLEVTVIDGEGEQISDRIQITVTPETIRHAFVPIELPDVFKPRRNLLLQNYPNPFNPETWIPYQLQGASAVVIQIYDARGGLVRTLNFGQREAGFYHIRSRAAYWNGRNDAGEPVASGLYFYRLSAKDFSATRRMLIVK